jgi:plastocyanin
MGGGSWRSMDLNKLMLTALVSMALVLAGCSHAPEEEGQQVADPADDEEPQPGGNGEGPDGQDAGEENDAGDEDPPDEFRVAIIGFAFEPQQLEVPVGSIVHWTNEDSATHTATSEDGVWDTGSLSQGDTASFTFDEPGDYPYICDLHPSSMTGMIHVVE